MVSVKVDPAESLAEIVIKFVAAPVVLLAVKIAVRESMVIPTGALIRLHVIGATPPVEVKAGVDAAAPK